MQCIVCCISIKPFVQTRRGVPFLLPPGSKLPKPSGYTSAGLPYYKVRSLLQFVQTGEQKDLPLLADMIECTQPKHVYLVLVTAPLDVIFKRREKDRTVKKRKVDRKSIEEEVVETEYFYRLHQEVVGTRAKMTSVAIDNAGPVESCAFRQFIKTLYATS